MVVTPAGRVMDVSELDWNALCGMMRKLVGRVMDLNEEDLKASVHVVRLMLDGKLKLRSPEPSNALGSMVVSWEPGANVMLCNAVASLNASCPMVASDAGR